MTTWLAVFRMRMTNGLQYRMAAFAGVVTQFFWGFLLIMVYQAFRAANPAASSMSDGQLASLVWLQQAFLTFIMLWFRDNELMQMITGGNVAYELCRPADLYNWWYARLIAQRVAAASLRCLPILAMASFLPDPWRLLPPADPVAAGLFLLTLVLGLAVLVSISMFIYISLFITMSPYGTMILFGTVGEFCAGQVIPLPLMPEALRNVMLWLPFRLASDLPFRTWSGHISHAEALQGIALQIIWLVVLVLAGRLAMARIMRRVVIQGG